MHLSTASDPQIMAIADPLMDNVMASSNDIDFDRHVRDFTPRLKAMITPAGFEKMCRQEQAAYGPYGRRSLVRIYRRQGSVAVVWVQYHEGSDEEHVASLVIVDGEDGAYQIDHALIY